MKIRTKNANIWLATLASYAVASPAGQKLHELHHKRSKCGAPSSGTTCTAVATAIETETVVSSFTITPEPVTSSTTEFETTTIVITTSETLTFSTTSTDFATETETTTSVSTAIATSSETTTSTAPIVTVPAPSGLVPIQSQFPPSATLDARAVRARAQQVYDAVLPDDDHTYSALRIEDLVVCTSTITTTSTSFVTVTTSTSTTLPAETYTFTSTSTVITDTTILEEPASTTLSFFITSTITETSTVFSSATITSTTTSTVTVPNPSPTFYAGCQADNILSDIDGHFINKLEWSPKRYTTLNGPKNAYECCVACMKRDSCAGAAWFAKKCASTNVMDTGTCDPGAFSGADFGVWTGFATGWTLSNGPCGKWNRV